MRAHAHTHTHTHVCTIMCSYYNMHTPTMYTHTCTHARRGHTHAYVLTLIHSRVHITQCRVMHGLVVGPQHSYLIQSNYIDTHIYILKATKHLTLMSVYT